MGVEDLWRDHPVAEEEQADGDRLCDGAAGEFARRAVGGSVGPTPEEPSAGNDQLEERLLGLSYDERREVQRRLTALGYNTYGIDGDLGTNSRRALASWQRDENQRASGYLTADQLRLLRRQTGG